MAAIQQQPSLSERYYLDNFNCLVDFVFKHYSPLLTAKETGFYNHYSSLPENAQRLAIRLLSRSTDYVRASKIHYDEITDIGNTLELLCSTQIVTVAAVENLPDWIQVFTQKELQSCLPAPVPKNTIETSMITSPDLFGNTPLDSLLESEQVIHITGKQSFITFRLLFFGNLYQDLSAFVLRDLGLRTFEPYRTDTGTLPFNSRAQLDACLAYYVCTELYDAASGSGATALVALHAQLPDTNNNDPTLKRRVERFSNKIARQLERLGCLNEAVEIYSAIERPPARERLTRIKAKLGHEAEAFDLCRQIESTAIDAEEKEFAQQFAARLAGKLGIAYQAPDKYTPDEIVLTLPKSRLPVEFAAALHFAKFGQCHYVENSLIGGIFGLAIWDILFSPVAGAFYHPFQNAPADFHESEFYLQREALFEKRFDEIQSGNLRRIVLNHFHLKYGINNPLVPWSHLNRRLLCIALKRIPVDHWIVFFNYLLTDIRNNRSGLPDLVHFPDNEDYSLLEVKGPGDRLQKNQLRWMKYFKSHGIRHAVVSVEYDTAPLEHENDPPGSGH